MCANTHTHRSCCLRGVLAFFRCLDCGACVLCCFCCSRFCIARNGAAHAIAQAVKVVLTCLFQALAQYSLALGSCMPAHKLNLDASAQTKLNLL